MNSRSADFQRAERVGDMLVKVIAELLVKEIADPRVQSVTLTAARVTKDLRQARVYFNLLGAPARHDDALAGLRSATGFIRSRLSKQMKLRYVPALEFVYDESADEAQRIERLLSQIKS